MLRASRYVPQRGGYVGSYTAAVSRRPKYPTSGADFTAQTGLTATSLYLCEEASGNMVDAVGGLTLTAAGTPVYGGYVGPKLGLGFNSTSDAFVANVHDLAAASGLYLCAAYHTTTPDSLIFGRTNAGSDPGIMVGVATPASGTLRGILRDDGANALTLAPALDVRGKLVLEILQVDRAANVARLFLKPRGEPAVTASGSIAGFSTFSAASQTFGLCNYVPGTTSQTGGFTATLLAVATGAQCQGTALCDAIAAGLGF
jgi:hypothetical protein